MSNIMRENTPNAKILINSLRYIGYENTSAINDIVDNSFDAEATQVNVSIKTEKNETKIYIVDNGLGMNEVSLNEAMRLGSISVKDEETDLGKFGMGLITASISIARRLTVITKKKDGICYTAIQDIDTIIETNEFVKELRVANEDEVKIFESLLKGQTNGTVVILEKCDNIKNRKTIANDLTHSMGRVFRKFIDSGNVVKVNNKVVKPIYPLMLNNGATLIKELKIPFNISKDEVSYIKVVISRLPVLSKETSKKMDLPINMKNQGFYILRNNREILSGNSLDLFTKHPSYNRIRAEISFSATLDERMGVNFTKKGFDMDDEVLERLNNEVVPVLNSLKNNLKNEDIVEESKDISHDESAKEIVRKKKLLDHPVSEPPKDNKKKKPEKEKEKEEEEPKPKDTEIPKVKKDKFDKSKADVEFGTKSMSRSGPIYDAMIEGGKLYVYYNMDHPFYQRFIMENKGNQNLINAVDFLMYALASAEHKLCVSEENALIMENFREKISSNMRTLLL